MTERTYLGEEWWVLDNALRLHRELGGKKGKELLLLRELKHSYPALPAGAVFASETPDFLLDSPGGKRIGLELVEIYRGGGRRKGSRHREREGVEESVLRLAEDLYYNADPPAPVHAVVHWPPDPTVDRRGPLPAPTPELAREIVRLVREGAPVWLGGGRLDLGAAELAGTPLGGVVRGLSARRTGFSGEDGRDSPWGRVLSYAPAAAGVAEVAREVEKKDRVYARCREACEEAWLVVVLGGGPSSHVDADDAVLDHRFGSAFDRVVLLCPGSQRGRRAVALLTER